MVEGNIADWPEIFFGSDKTVKGPRTITKERTNQGGAVEKMSVAVGYVEGLGTLTMQEYKIMLILYKLFQENNDFLSRPVSTPQLVRSIAREYKKYAHKPLSLKSIEQSITKLHTIPISWNNAWYDAQTKKWLTIEFTLLSHE